jgi:hypothetical protein
MAELPAAVADHQRVSAARREVEDEFHPLVLPPDPLKAQAKGALVGERRHLQHAAGKGSSLQRGFHGIKEADPPGPRVEFRHQRRIPKVEHGRSRPPVQEEGADAPAPEGGVQFPRHGAGQEGVPSQAHGSSIPNPGRV